MSQRKMGLHSFLLCSFTCCQPKAENQTPPFEFTNASSDDALPHELMVTLLTKIKTDSQINPFFVSFYFFLNYKL